MDSSVLLSFEMCVFCAQDFVLPCLVCVFVRECMPFGASVTHPHAYVHHSGPAALQTLSNNSFSICSMYTPDLVSICVVTYIHVSRYCKDSLQTVVEYQWVGAGS